MADSAVSVTPGAGASIDTYQISGGDHQQVVREARATSEAENIWQVTASAKISQIPADTSRVMILIVSAAQDRVYFRFDTTFPQVTQATAGNAPYHWYLDPGDRWEVPAYLVTLPVSMVGRTAGGQILSLLAMAA